MVTRRHLLLDAFLSARLICGPDALDIETNAPSAALVAEIPIALDLAPPTRETGGAPRAGPTRRRRIHEARCALQPWTVRMSPPDDVTLETFQWR